MMARETEATGKESAEQLEALIMVIKLNFIVHKQQQHEVNLIKIFSTICIPVHARFAKFLLLYFVYCEVHKTFISAKFTAMSQAY